MTIYLGADHAGYTLKEAVLHYLTETMGYKVRDFGTTQAEPVDYPDVVHPLAQAMKEAPETLGILACGSGNGVSMTANRYPHIRAGLAWRAELAALARQHNNANILTLPARFISEEEAIACVNAFLVTPFEGGRHSRRVSKISTTAEC